MNKFYIEAGINHFGDIKEAKKMLKFFLNSKFQNITFMLPSKKFFELQKKSNSIDFELNLSFYKEAILKTHKKKKKIGLSLYSTDTLKDLDKLNFDFYKLMSIGINNFDLIKKLKQKNKKVFVSTGQKIQNHQIKKCINFFKSKRNIELLHSPMSYDPEEINLSKIDSLRKKFNLKVGYSNHYNDINIINLLSAYNPSSIFIYCKSIRKKNRIYPDDKHAFYFDELNKMLVNYINFEKMNFKIKKIKKIKIFSKKLKK